MVNLNVQADDPISIKLPLKMLIGAALSRWELLKSLKHAHRVLQLRQDRDPYVATIRLCTHFCGCLWDDRRLVG